MERSVLILDFGTSNTRAVIVSMDSGDILEKTSIENEWLSSRSGYSEMNPDALWLYAQDAVDAVLKKAGDCQIEGIGFSFFGDSLIVTDENFTPLRSMIMAFDTRAQEEASELEEKIGKERFREVTGGACLSMLVCSKILWLKKQEPEVFSKAGYFLNIQEYILGKLGLETCTDYTLANRKMMFDIHRKEWSKELTDAVGIQAGLLGNRIRSSVFCAGTIRSFGRVKLPRELPVVIGAHDSECGLLGLGVSPKGNGILGNVSGTYEILGCFMERDVSGAAPVAELGCGILKESMIVNGSSIAGSYVNWFRKKICRNPESMFADMEKKVRYDGNSPIFFLTDNDRSRCTLDGFDTFTGQAELYGAIIEGITFKLKELLEEEERLNGAPFQCVTAGGGGSSSDKWMQFKADLFQKEVRRVDNQEVSALGAAMLTAVGIGYYTDFDSAIQNMVRADRVFFPERLTSERYQRKYQLYQRKKRNL